MRRLVGVGVGPGDPELVTVKAVRVLREADVVLVPVLAEDEPGRAEAIVRANLGRDAGRDTGQGTVRRVVFALNDRGGVTHRRTTAWDVAADTVLAAYEGNEPAETVAFATIGDPNIYSTFGYLAQTVRERLPDIVVETVPGITAMQDLAARSGTVLVEGTETLALVPLTAGVETFASALRQFDTVVGYKGGRQLPDVLTVVEDAGRLDTAVHGAGLGLPDEDVRAAADVTEPAPYLSTLLVPPRRRTRGGRL